LLLALTGWQGRSGSLSGQPPLRAFTLGLLAATVYFAGTIYWTGTVIIAFGDVNPIVAIIGMMLLSAYLAIYPAVAGLITSQVIARVGARGLFLAPLAWVATEYLRGYFLTGFPWVPLGNSQVTVLPVAQLASVLGVYGLSALVAYINATLAYALVTSGTRRVTAVATAAVVLIAVGGWGVWRIAGGSLTREGTPIRVGLIQGNIAQEDKWNPAHARRIFTTYIAMTRDAVRRGAEYVIWPESSTPFTFEDPLASPEGDAALRELAREVGVPILFGSDQVIRRQPIERSELYNAAYQLDPSGKTIAIYRKIKLVPFGEFFPFQEWIAFAAPLVQRFVPFSAGSGPVILPIGSHRASTAICYEVVFPSLARDAVAAGSELLTTVTNDGWYGRSSAPYQHWEMASMRAIEQGRYLARAANTGISGIVDPYGRVLARSNIFEQVGLVGEARFLTGRTVYSMMGDSIAYVSIVVTGLAAFLARRHRGSR
jgi:apolipoprotein N-acyltransferase